jgi:hypothetical protein
VSRFNGLTSYTIHIDGISGFYACPMGDFEGGPHSASYDTADELWSAIKTQTDTFLWPEVERINPMKNSQVIFLRYGGEPIALQPGDRRLEIGGNPPRTACRVVAEEVFQDLVAAADRAPAQEDQAGA